MALAQADRESGQCVEVPVHVAGLLRVELVRKDVGIHLEAQLHAVRDPEIHADSHAAHGKGLAVGPDVVHRVAGVVERNGLVVVEGVVEPDTCKEVGIDRACGIETSEEVSQIERGLDIALKEVVVVGRCGRSPGTAGLPAAQTETEPPDGRETVAGRESRSRRDKIPKTRLPERIGGSSLYLQIPVAVEFGPVAIPGCPTRIGRRNQQQRPGDTSYAFHVMKG